MYHKISDMISVIEVMNKKAQELREMKYGSAPRASDVELDIAIQDIQALARQIAFDTGKYRKDFEKDKPTKIKGLE